MGTFWQITATNNRDWTVCTLIGPQTHHQPSLLTLHEVAGKAPGAAGVAEVADLIKVEEEATVVLMSNLVLVLNSLQPVGAHVDKVQEEGEEAGVLAETEVAMAEAGDGGALTLLRGNRKIEKAPPRQTTQIPDTNAKYTPPSSLHLRFQLFSPAGVGGAGPT
eukprot:TRINITY_DN49182_c0_g1_i1.p2 TRINITY_DN49182_c0_g1~~TRINITY_DN49182_c0_g1_i1.p2  ORF type:complete len:163 (+),score=18.47 TRINITY_DN49182_c0_g1_i1:389-877(+)